MFRTLFLAALLTAQAADLKDAVWQAVQPALPYPAATDRNVPVDGSATVRWIVRRAEADEGDLIAEVVANPLNPDNQKRAEADMAAIQKEVIAAERRAQVEFDRALDDARASGRATTVQGITLDDEGIAGEKADAESSMTISLSATREVSVDASEAPTVKESSAGAPWIVRVSARTLARGNGSHYLPAEAIVCVSPAKPTVTETSRHVFTVRATAGVIVVLRGNAEVIDDVIANANWARLGGSKDPPLR